MLRAGNYFILFYFLALLNRLGWNESHLDVMVRCFYVVAPPDLDPCKIGLGMFTSATDINNNTIAIINNAKSTILQQTTSHLPISQSVVRKQRAEWSPTTCAPLHYTSTIYYYRGVFSAMVRLLIFRNPIEQKRASKQRWAGLWALLTT